MKLYHVTRQRNQNSIMKHGLIPKRTLINGEEGQHEQPKAVFFWSSLKRAKMICCYDDIVIKAEIPKNVKVFKRLNQAGYLKETVAYEYYVLDRVSPDRLEVVLVPEKNPYW